MVVVHRRTLLFADAAHYMAHLAAKIADVACHTDRSDLPVPMLSGDVFRCFCVHVFALPGGFIAHWGPVRMSRQESSL